MEPPPGTRPADGPRSSLAAFLSFVFPGLGQAYNGEAELAWAFAAPILMVIGAIVVVLIVGSSQLLAKLFDVRFLIGLIVMDAVLLAWRLVAVLQAYGHRAHPSIRSRATWAAMLLVTATLAMHAVPAYYAVKAIDTLDSVALGGSQGVDDSFGIGSLSEPSGQPDVVGGERVNVLLVGVDSGPGRTTALTDTMLVVSLDTRGTATAMISVPRDLYGVLLPDGTPFNRKLNSLMAYAGAHPDLFPAGGVGTLKATISELLGMPIHYFAAINMLGFKQAVDSIGGVDITVERAINDPTYIDEFGQLVGFHLKAGTYHMNGRTALAFVRSRKGVGDSDFTRADRQQQLLTAIRDKLTAGNLLLGLPGLLDAVKNTISTDVPSARLADLANAVQGADMSRLQRVVLQPPEYMRADPFSKAGYILVPDLDAIHALGELIMSGATIPTPEPSASP